ncbi:MAG: hypothetical protein IJ224_09025, partial [Lachnospiraceae bacterium]|nr:hypothetical protein [Lachnospiraceae bacterium]
MKKFRRINLLKLLTLLIITAIFFTMIFSQGVAHAEETDSDFNVYAYANRYEDLQKAYGGDLAAYERHYQTNGIKEYRNAKPYPGDDIRNSKLTFVYVNRVYNGVDY